MISTHSHKGFTLIEALILLFIFSVTVTAFYATYSIAVVQIIEAKKRLAAVGIANEQIETFRNMPFEEIVLDPGSSPTPPTGSVVASSAGTGLPYEVIEVINEVTYRVRTEIYFIDDPRDALGGAGDTIPNDYKEVIMTVMWGDGVTDDTLTASQTSLSSIFIAPSGNEAAITEGVLSVNVVDAEGTAISDFSVSVTDTNGLAAPDYTGAGTTDSAGNILFTNVPAGENLYRITVAKANYETISTLPPYPTTSYYPVYVDASIIGGTMTTVTIIDELVPTNFDMEMSDPYCQPIGGLRFDITGGRILGVDTSGDNVYVNPQFTVTGDAVTGIADIDAEGSYTPSAGNYTTSFSEVGYTFWRLSPGNDIDPTVTEVDAGVSHDCRFIVLNNAVDSLFVTVTDNLTGGPLESATVRAFAPALGYNVAILTDKYGKAYFPDNAFVPLQNGGTYTVSIVADGYGESVTDVTVTGLEQLAVTLIEET